MKIVHLSAYDSGGGAAKSAYRLHEWMVDKGYDSTFVVRKKRVNDSRVIQWGGRQNVLSTLRFKFNRKFEFRGQTLYRNLKSVHQSFAFDFRSPDVQPDFNITGDILQIHWIIGFLSFGDIVRISKNFKYVVWRFSDLNPATGGCVYNDDCYLYQTGCSACPIKRQADFQKLVSENYQSKKDIIAQLTDKLTVISQSSWMKHAIEQSQIFTGAEVLHIPNGLVINNNSQKKVHIKNNSLNVLSVSAGFDSERKGGIELINIWTKLKKDQTIQFSVAGGFNKENGLNDSKLQNVKFLGHLDKAGLYEEYKKADLLLFLNRQDNFPNVLLEAGMHGLPVIAFRVDGVTDIIEDGYNGWLFDYGDLVGVLNKLTELNENNSVLIEAGLHARKRIEERYDINIQGRKYFDLYKTKIARV